MSEYFFTDVYQIQRKNRLNREMRKKEIVPTDLLDGYDKERDFIEKNTERIQIDQNELNKVLVTNSLIVDPLVRSTLQFILNQSQSCLNDLITAKQIVEINIEKEIENILEETKKRKAIKEEKKEEKRQKLEEKGIPTDIQTKVIPSEQLNTVTEDRCGICLIQHTMRETITTNCRHHFGKYCFQSWIDMCKQQQKKVLCPCCNKRSPKFHGYRERIRKYQ
jgi:hypothetical protein